MAKFGSSSWSVFLVGGYNLLAAKIKSINKRVENILENSSGMGDSFKENTPVGMRRGFLKQTGAFFDNVANGIHVAFKDEVGVARVVCVASDGNTIGAGFTGYEGALTVGYEVVATLAELTKANAEYQISGRVDDGVIVQSHTQKTVDWNTKTDGFPVDYTLDPSQRAIPITSNSIANPSVVTTPVPHGLTTGDIILISGVTLSSPTINGQRTVTVISTTTFSVPVNVTVAGTGGSFVRANSSNGAVGYQQVSQFSGFTGFIGKIRDSADDVTYADLITFANVTAAPASERQEVAGVVDRYLSFDGNVTGTGTITVFAGLARK